MDRAAARARITGPGFIAALDQSGGSTPKALKAYGIDESAWGGDQEKMFALMHAMRARIIQNPAFDQRVSGAILFERTMRSAIDGMPTAQYLWERKQIVPFLKVDEGLADEADGVQLMKPMGKLDGLLKDAVAHGMFGTKMRSVVHAANPKGIAAIVEQQCAVAERILDAGLLPILEPEVSIKAPDKTSCEKLLKQELLRGLNALPKGAQVMLKLTLPEQDNFYGDLVQHPSVLRVVALSGGYSLQEANAKLRRNSGIIASFSRALVEGLRADQSEEEFTQKLDAAIQSIYQASVEKERSL